MLSVRPGSGIHGRKASTPVINQTASPRVAHVVGTYLRSTTTFIYQYISNMRRYQPLVLATFQECPERFPFSDLYVPDLTQVESILIKVIRRLFHRQILVDAYFREVLASHDVSVLHAHFGPMGVFTLPLRAQTKLPLVTTFYGFDMSRLPRKPGWRRSYHKLFSEGDLFLVEGSQMRRQLVGLGCPEEKVKIQCIGVDLGSFSYRPAPPSDEQVRILMCGRFVEKKGFEDGIYAFAQILPEFPKAQLRIVGDGPLRPSIVQLIDRLEINDQVELMGAVEYDVYAEEARQAHLFMAPSVTAANGDTEGGAPTVLLEMQARGLPVLSTFHADIPEIVVDGDSGYLVPEHDSAALSEKLAQLLAHPEDWDGMGRAGRAHVEKRHDIVTLAQELEHKYDALGAKCGR